MDAFRNSSSYFVDQWLKHHGSQFARKCQRGPFGDSDSDAKIPSVNGNSGDGVFCFGCFGVQPAGLKNWMMGRSEYVRMEQPKAKSTFSSAAGDRVSRWKKDPSLHQTN